jgi:hypothetical protein
VREARTNWYADAVSKTWILVLRWKRTAIRHAIENTLRKDLDDPSKRSNQRADLARAPLIIE